jgi:hypothetical protein
MTARYALLLLSANSKFLHSQLPTESQMLLLQRKNILSILSLINERTLQTPMTIIIGPLYRRILLYDEIETTDTYYEMISLTSNFGDNND